MEEQDFVSWLEEEIKKRNWSRAELSRRSGISSPQITRIMKREQSAGRDSLEAIAHAFKYPVEVIYRAAGILPAETDEDDIIAQILYELGGKPVGTKRAALELIRTLNRIEEQNSDGKSD